MNGASIGRIERVPLREVWKHEAYDFTQWLQNNIEVLNETINLTLVNVEREQAAGSFSIDLVAEDEGGGKVIIENQLEKSNHDHLGKLITYLSALNARAAIWIVAEPRPEHVAAVSWLNDSSSGSFYLLKMEAIKIGDSRPAPLLTVIVSPSDDKSAVAATNKKFAEINNELRRWWTMLVARPEARLHAHIAPGTAPWISTSSGVPGLALIYTVMQDQCGAELYIDRGKGSEQENEQAFDRLYQHKTEIENAFGSALSWERLDTKRACRIRASSPGGYRSPEEQWDEIQSSLVDTMNRLEAALRPYLRNWRTDADSTSAGFAPK